MKITITQLRRIIKEEVSKSLREAAIDKSEIEKAWLSVNKSDPLNGTFLVYQKIDGSGNVAPCKIVPQNPFFTDETPFAHEPSDYINDPNVLKVAIDGEALLDILGM